MDVCYSLLSLTLCGHFGLQALEVFFLHYHTVEVVHTRAYFVEEPVSNIIFLIDGIDTYICIICMAAL